MGLKYVGKKWLNSNLYAKLKIANKSDSTDLVVSATAGKFKNIATVKTDTIYITDSVKEFKDKEKVEEIVKYFLRNNIIKEIRQYDNKVSVRSTSGRVLDLCLTNDYSYLLNIIKMKYETDRLQFLEEHNDIKRVIIQEVHLENFKIVSNKTEYFIGYTEDEEMCIVLRLISNKGNILKFEQEFLKKYLTELTFGYEIINFTRFYERVCKIYCNGIMINLPFHFADKVLPAIMNHNYNLNEENNKQLKLEGIK